MEVAAYVTARTAIRDRDSAALAELFARLLLACGAESEARDDEGRRARDITRGERQAGVLAVLA